MVFLSALGAWAQSDTLVVRFVPFVMRDITPEEGRLIESLILSYISGIDGVSVYIDPDFPTEASPLPPPLSADALPDAIFPEDADTVDVVANIPEAPDYAVRITKNTAWGDNENGRNFVFSGSIYLENNNHVLSLSLDDGNENIKRTEQYRNAGEMALNLRAVIEDYFYKNTLLTTTARTGGIRGSDSGDETGDPLPLSVALITGTWQGDNGIELVRFSPGGKAVAYFSSGAAMELKYTIEDNTLTLIQQSLHNYRYYYPLPPDIARDVALKAEPMQWKLFLYDGGRTLRGMSVSTSADYDNDGVKKIMYGNVKNTNWVKISY
jgi:hypothetical protein